MKKEQNYLDIMKHTDEEKKWSLQYWVHDFGRLIMVPWCKLWYRPIVLFENEKAKEKVKGGAIVISNHQSYKDPLRISCALFPYRRIRYIGLHTFFERWYTKWLFANLLMIPINRDKPSMGTFREVINCVKKGWLVCIFPEGHVNWDSNISDFKQGVTVFAQGTGKPVVPTYVLNRKHFWEPLICAIGEPIDYNSISKGMTKDEGRQLFTEKLFEKEKLLEGICKGRYEKSR